LRILVSWLRDFVDVPVAPERLAETLSMRGFEVAAIEAPPSGPLCPEGEARDGSLPDAVIDLEITPNRPDCLSVAGIAREVATAYDRKLAPWGRWRPPASFLTGRTAGTQGRAHGAVPGLEVVLEDADLCPRYAASVADVTVRPSPDWLANRLLAAGVRPINNVVDVTNYVLVEVGHPMHAFDLGRLNGGMLRIRRAAQGERIRTLDGEERTLDAGTLVIADAERAQAIAGVMGGAGSEVWGGTRRIALESAFFKPVSVRRTSKKLGLMTEASYRFERGADISAPDVALLRACALLEQIGAGHAAPGIVDCYPAPRGPIRVSLRRERVPRVLGIAVDVADVERILGDLGFGLHANAAGWDVEVPTSRTDVAREDDLIEEVARHYGYDRLPTTFPALTEFPPRPDPRLARDRLARRVLNAGGFSEAITMAFIPADAASAFAASPQLVPIAYPLSEMFAVLRPSLVPGLVAAIAHNRRRERRDVQLFEIGSRFSATEGEHAGIAMAWTGNATGEHWSGTGRAADFYDMKGAVERLCSAAAIEPRFVPDTRPWLLAGRAAAVLAGDARIGVMGQLAPTVATAFGLAASDEVYVAELDASAIGTDVLLEHVQAQPLPRHPSIVRDVSILVDAGLPAGAVRGTIVRAAPAILIGVREFDRYEGKGVPEGRVSLALHLTFQASDRTLTDAEVDRAMETIVGALVEEHRAVRR
jgi:phenylalanyl-tRNA synthetase beta chain